MNTYTCLLCQSIWQDIHSQSSCPYCDDKTVVLPIASEKSIKLRLVQSHGYWSMECKGAYGETKSFEKISWKEKPSQHVLHETLHAYVKRLLEE